jgi:NADPH-dependent 2,4-dienoyl-CoA reductase/sulfur reductase-like enzyme
MRTIATVAITLSVEGRAVPTEPGQTVAAALIAAGIRVCRVTESGEGRGVFCGMGVCQECVMTIRGERLRACMTLVRDGMTVAPYRAGERLSAPSRVLAPAVVTAEVLVLGGGPAGLSAAAAAAEAGADVVLVDERAKLGGQFYKQRVSVADESALDRQYRDGRRLIARVEGAGVRVLAGVQVWGASGPAELLALDEAHAYALRPGRLVLATGAYERGVPLPGWTLPGFLTTGAAQTLMRAYGVLPGRRVLISGNGPLNIQVAAEIVRAGGEVAAVCELARFHPLGAAPMGAADPALMLQGARMALELRRAKVPLLRGHTVVRAEGERSVERATIARVDAAGRPKPGSERSFDVDAVCVGFGFLPTNELARTFGVAHRFDERLGQLAAVVDGHGRSSLDGVWIVGDGGGTGGAPLARAVGFLAGLDAVRSLGHAVAESREERAARRERDRSRRFQRGLNRLFAAPRLVDQLALPDTLVCRCEEVTLAAVEASFGDGAATMGAVKRVTRAGMGRCQGRYCAGVLADLSSRMTGLPMSENDWFAPAPPFKPIPVATAATGAATAQTD